MTRLEIPVAGMHCEGCARSLSMAVERLDGVRDARADFDASILRVSVDPARVTEAQLHETIEACGFRPLEQPATSRV